MTIFVFFLLIFFIKRGYNVVVVQDREGEVYVKKKNAD